MQHFFQNIQGWFAFREIYEMAVRKAPHERKSVFVELGAWRGRSSAFMGVEIANSKKPIDFHVIDHFQGSAEQIARQEPELVAGNLYETYLTNIAPVRDYITVHPVESGAANTLFEDGSIDFMLIDGAHDFTSVMRDLTMWFPKVKSGGLIAGDDYRKVGVREAVHQFFSGHGLIDRLVPCGGKAPPQDKCWRLRIPHDYQR